jgi:hypothetical protein
MGRNRLVAVFDESGSSNVPGEGPLEDFALGAVVFSGKRAWANLMALDARLQQITGQPEYKYRQVRQLSEARRAVVETLDHQSALIRVFGYYAAGGAFVEQAHRELEAEKQFQGDTAAAQQTLNAMIKDPRREGLKDAIRSSVPAMSAFAAARREKIQVYFDRRTDLADIADDLTPAMNLWAGSKVWGDSYGAMEWGGECPDFLEPVARVADIFAGDIRATFKAHGRFIWDLVRRDGFVLQHEEAAAARDSIWAGPIPVPKIGRVAATAWDSDWETGSTATTMFQGYGRYLLAGRASLFSPCGRGCLLIKAKDGFDVFQVMD